MKYQLTVEDIKKVRQAYNAGKLGAQNALRLNTSECLYVYPEDNTCHCAIGAMLPDDFLADILTHDANHGYAIGSLFEGPVLGVTKKGEGPTLLPPDILGVRDRLAYLQSTHDYWLRSDARNIGPSEPSYRENEFLDALDNLEDAVGIKTT